MAKRFHGHIKVIYLVTVIMLFVFYIVKLATTFILDKLKNLNKELQKNSDVKARITAHAGYGQNNLETATNPIHIFKYFHFIMKQILHFENIKRNDAVSDGDFH